MTDTITVTIIHNKITGAVRYDGIPEPLREFLFNYSNEELAREPINVVKSIIRMQAILTKGSPLVLDMQQDQ